MCGIAGIFEQGGGRLLVPRIRRMTGALTHRGPDGSGEWINAETGIALGHRRLSIIDLSQAGSQPMASVCGRYRISYNGELYNTSELRERLSQLGVRFVGTSDTEVLVNAVAAWGLEAVLQDINGIYAFAIWDRQTRTLSLVRDRMGVKPLYWSYSDGKLLFASEVRAFAALPEFDRSIDMEAVGSLLRYNYILSPMTIYRAARSLEPGMVLTVPPHGAPTARPYWNISEVVARKAEDRAHGIRPEEAVERLEALLNDAVSRQLVSDVPIGVFLSGGVDSSTVAALAQKAAGSPVRSFSIGFESSELNEAVMAKAVADHLGTDHTELYVTEKDALDCVPRLPIIYDQPLADPSGIPTFLLCSLARRHVTVALTGDGGDESFHGYSRYAKAARIHSRLSDIPQTALSLARQLANVTGAGHIRQNGFEYPGKLARAGWHASRLLNYAGEDVRDVYMHFLSHWPEPEAVAPGSSVNDARWQASKRVTSDLHELMMLYDSLTYMTDCVLAKTDRASMASSLEARVPLLDHRIVELAWSLPTNVKYRDGASKWILRQVLHKYVPQALVDRPKAGFGAPIGLWLRTAIRDWAEDLLSRKTLRKWGIVDPTAIEKVWKAHLSGRVDAGGRLWSILMLHAWLEETGSPAPAIGASDWESVPA